MKKFIISTVLMLALVASFAIAEYGTSPFGPVPPSDVAYDEATWDDSYLAPTQNAMRDWIEGAGGGGIGGIDTQVQYNDAGYFGGDAGFTYDDGTDTLTLDGDILAATFIADPSTAPAVSFRDSDQADPTEVTAKIFSNVTTVTDDATISDMTLQATGAQGTAGTLETFAHWDGSLRTLITYGSIIPGQETITCAADACVEDISQQTHFIVSEGGAEVDADALALDNGIVTGQEATFIFKTESDVGDTVVIDTAQQVGWGSFTMDAVGDSITFIWDGTNWTIKCYYLGTVA